MSLEGYTQTTLYEFTSLIQNLISHIQRYIERNLEHRYMHSLVMHTYNNPRLHPSNIRQKTISGHNQLRYNIGSCIYDSHEIR